MIFSNLNQSADEKDVDVSINVDDMEKGTFGKNKTKMISTAGANDIDIDGFPKKGVTVLITKEAVMVTANPVHVLMNKELSPSIVDEIRDVAKEQSNGSVIIDTPPIEEQPRELITSSASGGFIMQDEDRNEDEEQSQDEEEQNQDENGDEDEQIGGG